MKHHPAASSVPILLVAIASPGVAQERSYASEDGTVRCTEGEDQVVWENRHDRKKLALHGDTKVAGPVKSGSGVWYAVGSSLYQADAETGRIRTRTYLPSPATKLEATGTFTSSTPGSGDTEQVTRRGSGGGG